MEWSPYDSRGRRKYLVPEERWALLETALVMGGEIGTFCAVLVFCGARLSEVLALTPERIDEGAGTINFETLKRRRRGIIRVVPVPRKLLDILEDVHKFREANQDDGSASGRLWTWSRKTAWWHVKATMLQAGIPAFLAMPKAIRHAFCVCALLDRIAITTVQKWMGHSRLETTQIYADIMGAEDRALAQMTWVRAPEGFQQ